MNANKQGAGGLLPCPFCGEQPSTGYHGDGDCGYHYVECMKCCRDRDLEAERFIGAHGENPEDCASLWNRRNGEQCRAASGDVELRETAEHNWLFIQHVSNWIIGRGLLEITHEGGSLEAAKNITDSLDRALSRGVPEDVARDAADAARYRWMRNGLQERETMSDEVVELFDAALDCNDREKFVKAIDAAIAASKAKGESNG